MTPDWFVLKYLTPDCFIFWTDEVHTLFLQSGIIKTKDEISFFQNNAFQ